MTTTEVLLPPGCAPGGQTSLRPDPDVLARLRREDTGIRDIAAQVGLSRSSVYRWMARNGLPAVRVAAGWPSARVVTTTGSEPFRVTAVDSRAKNAEPRYRR